jgi:hypothetical protein
VIVSCSQNRQLRKSAPSAVGSLAGPINAKLFHELVLVEPKVCAWRHSTGRVRECNTRGDERSRARSRAGSIVGLCKARAIARFVRPGTVGRFTWGDAPRMKASRSVFPVFSASDQSRCSEVSRLPWYLKQNSNAIVSECDVSKVVLVQIGNSRTKRLTRPWPIHCSKKGSWHARILEQY